MASPPRRGAAAAVVVTLVALVVCDLSIAGFQAWWDRHALTTDVACSLLVVAVTALIFDEVVARRQRRDRATSVAIQGLIVFEQGRRTYEAAVAGGAQELGSSAAPEELRTLASMLLTASPSLFDDPVARRFLSEVERFTGLVFRALSVPGPGGLPSEDAGDRLAAAMLALRGTAQPLLDRLPTVMRSALENRSPP